MRSGQGWAHLEGHGGYVLPERPNELVANGYVTLWLGGDSYLYLLLPGASEAQTRERAADSGWFQVLANTSRQQGVHIPSLRLTAVNFWQPGSVGGLTADRPCSILLRGATKRTWFPDGSRQ